MEENWKFEQNIKAFARRMAMVWQEERKEEFERIWL